MPNVSPHIALARLLPNRAKLAAASALFFVAALLIASGCVSYQPRVLQPAATALAIEDRSLTNEALRVFINKNLRQPLAEWPPHFWSFENLTLAAFFYHPSLEVARATWGVSKAGVVSAGARPNPTLSVEPGYTLNPGSGANPWIPLASFDFPIETAGKRTDRISQAEHLAEAARYDIVETAWEVRGQLLDALIDEVAAERRLALSQAIVEARQRIVRVTADRVQAGAAARNDLISLRLAAAKALADQAEAGRQKIEARARVAESVGVPMEALEGVALDREWPVDSKVELTAAEARTPALLRRPDILGALENYQASEAELRLEIAKQYPDFHLSPSYQFDQGEHKWSVGLSVELPLLDRNQGPIAEAEAKREESRARFIELQTSIIAAVDRAVALRAAALNQEALFSSQAAMAQDALNSVKAQVAAGAADALDLAGAQLDAQSGALDLLDADVQAHHAMASLEQAVQGPLGAPPNLESNPMQPAKTGSNLQSQNPPKSSADFPKEVR